MKNLRNTHYNKWKIPDARQITAIAWDVATDTILCTIGPSENDAVIELIRTDMKSKPLTHQSIASWEALCPNPDIVCDEVISLHYFADILTTYVIFKGGDIVAIIENNFQNEKDIELIGSFDEGITAAKWSPDEELLAITTNTDKLIFMSKKIEVVKEVIFSSEDLKLSNQISVGWGKKETQFRGKGARALKDPTMPDKIDEGVLSPNDDFKVSMSWRGDGAFIVISSVEAKKRRVLRVYSRECLLDSISEPIDGLEGALSWRPSGNIIASIQRLENRVDVVFFERNGLRHGQFSLRVTPAQLQCSSQNIQLQWNSDSTVLAVIMAEHLEFWTMGNYHWYLKQQISYGSEMPVIPLLWHPEIPLRCMFASKDSLTTVEYICTTAQTAASPLKDFGVVAVIDGKTVKVTPFRTANIPPPMFLLEIEVESNVIDVSLNEITYSIAILHQTGISVFGLTNIEDPSACHYLIKDICLIETNNSNTLYQQISWACDNVIVTLQNSGFTSSLTRSCFDKDCNKTEMIESADAKCASKSSSILTLSSFFEGDCIHAFTQNNKGEIQSLENDDRSSFQFKFPFYLPWVQLVSYGGKIFAVGMSSNGSLYANNLLIAKNCTSFLTTQVHIIFTTTSHTLKFIHITDIENLDVLPNDNEVDERCRNIERGARLVTAIPTDLSVVLQMPRGNLETIYPRAMVLAGIRKLIEEKNYRKAYTHCRTHRVDMNLLYDYAPQQFLLNVELFVNQIKRITYLDLFLSSLREEDVTKTMYMETRISNTNDSNFRSQTHEMKSDSEEFSEKTSKINKICDACLEVFKTRTSEYLQNIVTALVCKSPPALDDGLIIIANLIDNSPLLAEKAAQHICFLADVNKLYDNALGLYNIDLALRIVQNSQRDPQEYLPFLQNLLDMTPLRRQFSIDNHLGKHAKALIWLYEIDEFNEIKAYVQKHSLYLDALSLYQHKPTNYAIIMSLYASFLESKSDYSSAALAYESLSNYTNATSCYLSSGSSYWRQTLHCALSQSPPISGQALIELATSLYDSLYESKDFYSAATIQLEYLSSVPDACNTLCKGHFFVEALHLCTLKKQPELLQSVVEPGLMEAFASSTGLLADFKAQILAQVPRIRELREKALRDPLAFYEGERSGVNADIPDDISVVADSHLSTNCSLFTRYTGKGKSSTVGSMTSRATSKHRKKEERKRAKGKKGSVYEEEYLVNSFERLIRRVESTRGEISRLIEGLIRRGMWEQAKSLETSLEALVKSCASTVPEVFKVETKNLETHHELPKQTGGAAVLQESFEALERGKDVPIIAPFKKMSLLG
ncbi:Elongator complex protein 1 [Golovinomyces cichoracearum]|uniref:Elongator complex protein 1 n=1 Tax=Golovinomyces cichoracearum TaxID=62708 RepID=A0A420HQZ6_9PEZI|nr:Elongator complex protein 1 [Golovinomyces cichoracearum]